MNVLKQIILFWILFCTVSYSMLLAQNKLARFSFKGEGGIPTVLSSQAFKNTFVGEFQTGGQFVVRIFPKFYSGVGFNYALFKTSNNFQFRIGNVTLTHDFFLRTHNTNLILGAFLPVEVDKDKPNQFGSIELRIGYSYNKYTNVVLKVDSGKPTPLTEYYTTYIQPHFSYTFMVEENLGFGGFINYTMYFNTFNPSHASFDKYVDYTKWNNRFNISWITLGLHFHWYFIKVQRDFSD